MFVQLTAVASCASKGWRSAPDGLAPVTWTNLFPWSQHGKDDRG